MESPDFVPILPGAENLNPSEISGWSLSAKISFLEKAARQKEKMFCKIFLQFILEGMKYVLFVRFL